MTCNMADYQQFKPVWTPCTLSYTWHLWKVFWSYFGWYRKSIRTIPLLQTVTMNISKSLSQQRTTLKPRVETNHLWPYIDALYQHYFTWLYKDDVKNNEYQSTTTIQGDYWLVKIMMWELTDVSIYGHNLFSYQWPYFTPVTAYI